MRNYWMKNLFSQSINQSNERLQCSLYSDTVKGVLILVLLLHFLQSLQPSHLTPFEWNFFVDSGWFRSKGWEVSFAQHGDSRRAPKPNDHRHGPDGGRLFWAHHILRTRQSADISPNGKVLDARQKTTARDIFPPVKNSFVFLHMDWFQTTDHSVLPYTNYPRLSVKRAKNRHFTSLVIPNSQTSEKWLIDRLIEWLSDWLVDWLVGWLIDRLIGWLIDWVIDRLIGWLIDWVIDWLIDWLIDFDNMIRWWCWVF